jgi:hypothetical protein
MTQDTLASLIIFGPFLVAAAILGVAIHLHEVRS